MSTCVTRAFLATLCLFFLAIALNAQNSSATPPDETLYTSYFFSGSYQNVSWIVCGSTQQSEGCYGFGQIGPFGNIGALMESNATVSGNTVTRYIYIVDSNPSGGGVELFVYKKTDVVSASTDITTVTFDKSVSLGLSGGSSVATYMAANERYLFVGTNVWPQAVQVQKSNLKTSTVEGNAPVSAITSDAYGYVTITFGDFLSGGNGFATIGPNGQNEGGGGGAWFLLNTQLGVSTAALPASDK